MPRAILVLLIPGLLMGQGSTGERLNLQELTREQEKAVCDAAEKALKAQDLWKGKIYLTNTEIVFDHQANSHQGYALLTFYRYDGDLAILATVRLEKLTVAKVAVHPHMPTSLARQEIADAEKMARAHPDIQRALARYSYLDKIEVDTLAAQIINPEVPGYRHRVARLYFRDGQRNYLASVPMVDVDLTTGEVRFDLIRALHNKK